MGRVLVERLAEVTEVTARPEVTAAARAVVKIIERVALSSRVARRAVSPRGDDVARET